MNTHDISTDDLILYAMHGASPDELARIAEHIPSCTGCRAELERIQADLAAVALTVPQVNPPARVRETLLREIQEQKAEQLGAAPASGMFSRQRWWSAVYVAALLLAIAAGLLWTENARLRFQLTALRKTVHEQQVLHGQDQAALDWATQMKAMLNSREAMRVTMVAGPVKPQPRAQVIYSHQQGRLLLIASDLRPLPPKMAYELWLMPKDGAPMACGTFKPDASGNATMLHGQMPVGMQAKAFALTLEPEEGSPAPTSQPLLMGKAS